MALIQKIRKLESNFAEIIDQHGRWTNKVSQLWEIEAKISQYFYVCFTL